MVAHTDSNVDRPTRARQSFSVRLPAALYEALDGLSDERGESMNKLIGTAVARLVDRPDLDPAEIPPDIDTSIAAEALYQGGNAQRSIAPLKGIANHARNRDQVALACVLWAAAARLVAEEQGPEAAARELAHSASVADDSNRLEIAVTLWEEALRLDPNNLEAVNRLGQRLHHLAQRGGDDIERYREAERQLARVTFIDNRAKLFHGWSALHVARADGDSVGAERAEAEIDEAMKAWAFGTRDGQERYRWIRQLVRLRKLGLESRVTSLVEFANQNANWDAISDDDLNP